MDQLDIEELLKDLNTRTGRIEQKLPTLATTTDVREEAERMRQHVDKEAERTRQHFDVVAEGMKDSLKVIADGHKALSDRITTIGRDIRSVLDNHERRITTLEAHVQTTLVHFSFACSVRLQADAQRPAKAGRYIEIEIGLGVRRERTPASRHAPVARHHPPYRCASRDR